MLCKKEKSPDQMVRGLKDILFNGNKEYEVAVVKCNFVRKTVLAVAAGSVSVDNSAEEVECALFVKCCVCTDEEACHTVDDLSVVICVPVDEHAVAYDGICVVHGDCFAVAAVHNSTCKAAACVIDNGDECAGVQCADFERVFASEVRVHSIVELVGCVNELTTADNRAEFVCLAEESLTANLTVLIAC